MNSKICVIGLGYVGLPLALLCAKRGFKTIGFDIDEAKVFDLQNGVSSINDPFIISDLKDTLRSKCFHPTNEKTEFNVCNTFIICVPTPTTSKNEPDIKEIVLAVENVAPHLSKGDLIIVESTVYPGTCEDIIVPLLSDLTNFQIGIDISLAHCPERINPGDKFWNSENIPRVIGGIDQASTNRAAEFYSKLLNGPVFDIKNIREHLRADYAKNEKGKVELNQIELGAITLMKSIRDAEAVKVMENTVRDVNIAFVNELAKISNVLNLDVVDIIDGMATKPFGKGPFYPGAGVGGHCIAVDPEWLKSASIKAGYMPEMIELARSINKSMPEYTFQLLRDGFNQKKIELLNASVAILGVAYKKNVGDTRESPFFEIKKLLENHGVNLTIYDTWNKLFNTHESLGAALSNSLGVIIITDHDNMLEEFEKLPLKNLNIEVLIDGRNCIKKSLLAENVIYKGIGKN